MADVLAVPYLITRVRAQFATDGVNAAVHFGRREKHKQINQGNGRANRVVFQPGDNSGAIGAYAPARNPGGNPRPLLTLNEKLVVFIWAFDASNPADELTQYQAVRFLHDTVIRAIHLTMCGRYSLGAPQLVVDNGNERVFGAEIAVPLAIEALIPDSVAMEVTEITPETDYDISLSEE